MLKLARVVRGCSPLRTLESLESDHQRFLEAGGDIKKAKEFNNPYTPPSIKWRSDTPALLTDLTDLNTSSKNIIF